MKLSSRQIGTLPAGDHKDEGGLMLRVSKDGKTRTWSLAYSFGPKRRKMKLGTYPAMSLSGARTCRDEQRGIIAGGVDPMAVEIETAPEAGLSVSLAVAEYLETEVATLKPSSQKSYTHFLTQKLVPMLGEKQLADVTRQDIAQLNKTLLDAGTPSSAAGCFRVVKRFLTWCTRTRAYLDHNPAGDVAPPKQTKARERSLEDHEIAALMHTVRGRSDPNSLMVHLLMLTAARLNEIAQLQWSAIDLEEGLIRLDDTKNGRQHLIPLSDQALCLLRTLPRHGPYIISGSLGRAPFSGFSRAKKRLDADSGVTGWRNHDLRRTAATILRRLGVDRYTVSATLNHTVNDVTSVYDKHDLLPEKRQALQQLADHYDEIAGQQVFVALAG